MTLVVRADEAGLSRAAALIRAGEPVAFPTETVYGLGADARSDVAVARLYAAKERPRFNPLIAHVLSVQEARREGVFGPEALALASAFWPGPLTLVVPVTERGSVCGLARAGLGSVALRVPAHPIALAVIAAVGGPVAAPSANRSGRVSPTEAAHVLGELDGRIPLVVDGGACAIGVESTILSCLDGAVTLLRPGGVGREAIETVLERRLYTAAHPEGAAPVAPGLLASHYAPAAVVRLGATEVREGEAVLDFGGALAGFAGRPAYLDLSPAGDLAEAAARLFGFLRRLDAAGLAAIAIAPVPETGPGEAINDRLRRAAAPRPKLSRPPARD